MMVSTMETTWSPSSPHHPPLETVVPTSKPQTPALEEEEEEDENEAPSASTDATESLPPHHSHADLVRQQAQAVEWTNVKVRNRVRVRQPPNVPVEDAPPTVEQHLGESTSTVWSALSSDQSQATNTTGGTAKSALDYYEEASVASRQFLEEQLAELEKNLEDQAQAIRQQAACLLNEPIPETVDDANEEHAAEATTRSNDQQRVVATATTPSPQQQDELERLRYTVNMCQRSLVQIQANADLKVKKLELEVAFLQKELDLEQAKASQLEVLNESIRKQLRVCLEEMTTKVVDPETGKRKLPYPREGVRTAVNLHKRELTVEKHLNSLMAARNQAQTKAYHYKRLLINTCRECRMKLPRKGENLDTHELKTIQADGQEEGDAPQKVPTGRPMLRASSNLRGSLARLDSAATMNTANTFASINTMNTMASASTSDSSAKKQKQQPLAGFLTKPRSSGSGGSVSSRRRTMDHSNSSLDTSSGSDGRHHHRRASLDSSSSSLVPTMPPTLRHTMQTPRRNNLSNARDEEEEKKSEELKTVPMAPEAASPRNSRGTPPRSNKAPSKRGLQRNSSLPTGASFRRMMGTSTGSSTGDLSAATTNTNTRKPKRPSRILEEPVVPESSKEKSVETKKSTTSSGRKQPERKNSSWSLFRRSSIQ